MTPFEIGLNAGKIIFPIIMFVFVWLAIRSYYENKKELKQDESI